MKSQIINHLVNRSSVLRRIYLLIALLIASVLLVAVILVGQLQKQQTLHDKISRFHAPIIYYTEKITTTLHDTKYNISLHKEKTNESKLTDLLVNHIYSTQNHAHTIQTITKSYPNFLTDNAQTRLQQAIDKLSNVINDPSITNQDKFDLLPALIEATMFRVTQLNRLHVNLNDKKHHILAQREKDNTTFLIQLTAIIFILASILAVPLLISIHRMVKSLQDTEQHQRKLRETAEIERSRMWALLYAMNIGVLFEDKKGCIEFINPAFYKIWGIEPSIPITGQRLSKLLGYFSPHVAYQKHSSEHLFHVADTLKVSERIDITLNNDHTLTQSSFPVI
ncbi:MAG: PAS domain-containing protein, partial [Nitrosomonas sp.]|nr:PAS domain-containing protein [Nitrosomonas sp.]